MGTRVWSVSDCRSDVWWEWFPDQGCWYWTSRFGYVWVPQDILGIYGGQRWECGSLGAAVKPSGYISEHDARGQWFEHGCIYNRYGYWVVVIEDRGQTAGRLTDGPVEFPHEEGRVPQPPAVVPRHSPRSHAMQAAGA